jgi:hypothetical protein
MPSWCGFKRRITMFETAQKLIVSATMGRAIPLIQQV